MFKKGRIAIIVEGVRREPKYLCALQKCCLSSIEMDILCLPAEQNIYMLWKQMQDDDLETDLIEVVRESSAESAKQLDKLKRDDFMEVYLLFDFDPHQDNLRLDVGVDPADVLRKMAETFDNETEAGKLYVSYPMIEALRDIRKWSCLPHYQCEVPASDIPQYKNLSGEKNSYTDVRKYTEETWKMLVAIFLVRCKCLFSQDLNYDALLAWYKTEVSPAEILEQQVKFFTEKGAVFVLSALPELLLDYFGARYWENLTGILQNVSHEDCVQSDRY